MDAQLRQGAAIHEPLPPALLERIGRSLIDDWRATPADADPRSWIRSWLDQTASTLRSWAPHVRSLPPAAAPLPARGAPPTEPSDRIELLVALLQGLKAESPASPPVTGGTPPRAGPSQPNRPGPAEARPGIGLQPSAMPGPAARPRRPAAGDPPGRRDRRLERSADPDDGASRFADAWWASAAQARPGDGWEQQAGSTIYVANAGLVLIGVYLPRLFDRLGLLREEAFADAAAAARATLLTQFLVDGQEVCAEHRLPLNKLLCGVPFERPLPVRLPIDDETRGLAEGLLEAVIAHWAALGSTSVAGLRESFLQRAGALRRVDERWLLRVEDRAFDMLLDHVPWGFRTIRFAWMPEVLHVEWR